MPNELKIVINTSANVEGIKKASSTLGDLERSASGVSKSTDRVASSIDGLSSKVTRATGLLAGAFAFDKLTDSATSFISTAAQFEQYAVSLEVLSGSASKAGAAFDWVKDFTAKTPYTLNETMEAFIRLKAYGIDATDGSLKTLGDTSAALSKPLMAAVEAMADAMTGENERLKEFGITASVSGNKIAYNWIDSSGQAKTKIIDNNKQIIKSTLEAIFNEKYAGMMDKQSQTLNGMVSNLEDTWTGVKDAFANDTGAFDAAKSAISGVTDLLQTVGENKDEILTFGKYATEAAVAIVAYKGAMISVSAVQKLHSKYLAASTVATTSYSIATNTTSTAVTTLTARQVAANAAVGAWNRLIAINPYAIAGAAIIGVGMVLKNQADELRDSVRRTAIDVDNLSAKALQAKITYATIELDKVNESINNPSIMQSLFGNERIALHKKVQLEQDLVKMGRQLQNLSETSEKAAPKVEKALAPLTPKQIKEQERAVEALKTAYKEMGDAVFGINATDIEKELKAVDDQADKWRKTKGVKEADIEGAVSKLKASIRKKYADQAETEHQERQDKLNEISKRTLERQDEETTARFEKQRSAMLDYYKSVGDETTAFYIEESDKIARLAETGILSNEELIGVLEADQETFRKSLEKTKDATIKLNTVFEDAFKSMEDSMVNAFMTGKFEAEDFFNTIIEGIIRMQIRNSITQPLTTAIGSIDFSGMFSGIFGAYDGGMIPEYYLGGAVNNFAYGGYTGDGGKYEPKGVVHGGEYVIPKWQVQRIPSVITQLESMRKRGYADGGAVGSSVAMTGSPNVVINVENKSGTPISAENVGARFDGRSLFVDIFVDAINRNVGGARDAVRAVR